MRNYFEFKDVIQNPINERTWIPVRAEQYIIKEGQSGYNGYQEEYLGTVGIIIDSRDKHKALDIEWIDANSSSNAGWVNDNDDYILSGIFQHGMLKSLGNYLVLKQLFEDANNNVWHLDQDFILALKLIRQDDSWICPSEDSQEVARLERNKKGAPVLFEVRKEYLLDYLSARRKGLLLVTFRSRTQIQKEKPNLPFTNDNKIKRMDWGKFSGTITEIHEGGFPKGEEIHVIKITPKKFNKDKDVPELTWPVENDFGVESYVKGSKEPNLFRVHSEAWINYWLEPGESSPRIRGDDVCSKIQFITDNDGRRTYCSELINSQKWLWFKSSVVNEILSRKDSFLEWYSENTGSVGPNGTSGVHFGVNKIGLINVFAKDIAELDTWIQLLWVAHNVCPEGGVSDELIMAQVNLTPAKSIAPEESLINNIDALDKAFKNKFGSKLYVAHGEEESIKKRINRFQSSNNAGLYTLAKDIYRLVVERINTDTLKSILHPSEDLGSIKLLALLLDQESINGRQLTSILVGLYDLRKLDAHLPSRDIESAYKLSGIDYNNTADIICGKKLIASVSKCLLSITKALK